MRKDADKTVRKQKYFEDYSSGVKCEVTQNFIPGNVLKRHRFYDHNYNYLTIPCFDLLGLLLNIVAPVIMRFFRKSDLMLGNIGWPAVDRENDSSASEIFSPYIKIAPHTCTDCGYQGRHPSHPHQSHRPESSPSYPEYAGIFWRQPIPELSSVSSYW